MDLPVPSLTPPIIQCDGEMWFSAYAFGWGYCAFSMSAETICTELGAANETQNQLLLAFELGKRRLSQAVQEIQIPSNGERIALALKQA
ncbi:hypothetical protein NDK50_14900 [Paraburkholderia bryophila]|uniref:hypothetical protein n=1 Tax=Paraburkholderia bryophila TaxID=420952 RepID=UPI00234A1600|nr:hypothetical protein [Paraburkholderia bryophila]WCM18721.1 hypothetical protein NDK50_14900 [Paraburkholderia bryophila]